MRFALQLVLAVLAMSVTSHSFAGCEKCTKNFHSCVVKAKGTASEVQTCQSKEEEIQEAQLNVSYQRALKRLTPERQKELRDVQRRWVAYRLAASRYYVDTGLSGYKISSSDHHLQLTVERITELDQIDY